MRKFSLILVLLVVSFAVNAQIKQSKSLKAQSKLKKSEIKKENTDEFIIEEVNSEDESEIEIIEIEEEEENSQEIFFIVEQMPTFQGQGSNGFRTYISKNLNYPKVAQENEIQGRVFVQFVVTKDGDVANAKVIRGVDPALDKEALRVIMSSPKWEPGEQRGEKVNVAFTFPVVFRLQ